MDVRSREEREDLLARLQLESKEMKYKFAILVDRTRASLEDKGVTCEQLKAFVAHTPEGILHDVFDQNETITKLFFELRKYWSFFDYELLEAIIIRHCPDLQPRLDEYISELKRYCERKLCEVPNDAFESRGDAHKLYVQRDTVFDEATLKDDKDLKAKLSRLLGRELFLLGVDEGSITFIFNSFSEIDPLTSQQKRVLKEMEISRLFSDTIEYFNIR